VLLNGGLREKITCQIMLMLAVGRAVTGDAEERPRLLLFGGVQLNLPGLFHFSEPGGSLTRIVCQQPQA
jgi:hypothetical protein